MRTSTVAPMRAAVRRSASARPGWRSTATSSPDPSISAARWVVLPPGAAHRSSTRSPGRGASSRATVIDARDCGMKLPRSHSGEANASNGPSSTSPSGRPGAGCDRDGQARRQLGRVGAQRVDAQGGLGRLVVRGHQRARGVRAQRLPPQRGDPLGWEWRSAACAGVASSSAATSAARLAGAAAQHGVDELRAAGRLALDQLDGLADRRVGGHAVRVGELVEAEAQRGEHERLEPLDRAPGERLDQVVERRPALHRAVGQAHRERALARVEPEPARLAVQRAVGPRPVLEDAPQHGKRACTRRRTARAPGIRFRRSGDPPL